VILFEVQGLLLITTEHGEIVLLEANPNLHTEVARFEALTGKTWNHPIVVRHRLVVRNNKEAVCYDLSAGAE
jgi:outer membrane protein assembly factor BamB